MSEKYNPETKIINNILPDSEKVIKKNRYNNTIISTPGTIQNTNESLPDWVKKLSAFDSAGVFYDLVHGYKNDKELKNIAQIENTARKQRINPLDVPLYEYKSYKLKLRSDPTESEIDLMNTEVHIAELDKKYGITFLNDRRVGAFICIKNNESKDRSSFNNLRFDINFARYGKYDSAKNNNGESILVQEKFTEFVNDVLLLAQDQDIGIDIKPLVSAVSEWNGKYPLPKDKTKMAFIGDVHLYPRFPDGLSEKEIEEKLINFFNSGKQKWGTAFQLNLPDFQTKVKDNFPKFKSMAKPEYIKSEKIDWNKQ